MFLNTKHNFFYAISNFTTNNIFYLYVVIYLKKYYLGIKLSVCGYIKIYSHTYSKYHKLFLFLNILVLSLIIHQNRQVT